MEFRASFASVISIHALHEESDIFAGGQSQTIIRISIHALHEESDFLAAYYNNQA